MAIREIRVVGDRVLTKKCRPVEKMTPRISELIDDMFDTMYEANGVGLAAPQVGILKRIVVMDVDGTPHLLINPEILETSGSQTGAEGCLSLPGKSGTVTRPNYVKVRALDRDMQPFELENRTSCSLHLPRVRSPRWTYVYRKSRRRTLGQHVR